MNCSNHRNSAASFLLTFGIVAVVCAGSVRMRGRQRQRLRRPLRHPGRRSLTQNDVMMLVQAAATAAQSDTMAIAVVDRLGRILAVYKGASAPAQVPGNFGNDGARR